MNKQEWQGYAQTLKELFGLENSPVAVSCIPGKPAEQYLGKRLRICKAILDAARGESVCISAQNNACFGASWHLGFQKAKDKEYAEMVRKFVVEGEKLFCSSAALDNLMAQLEEPPDNSNNFFMLSALEKAQTLPASVIFLCNAEVASRLLTFMSFSKGLMPEVKIGGPTCRMMIIYPLLKNAANLSFYDYTSRKICGVEKDKLLVSIPYSRIPEIISNIDKCSAGKAKIEFPAEFRRYLRRQLFGEKSGE